MKTKFLAFYRSLDVRYILLVLLAALCLAVINNLRAPEPAKVEWIGGQEVLPKPEDL
jgi:hypothetical protein